MDSNEIELYTHTTFNGRKVSIMLEELAANYTVFHVNLGKGEHKKKDYLDINPSGRVPTIIDRKTDSGQALIINQSAAILMYLAEKYDQLMPKEQTQRARALEWLAFSSTDISSTLFNAFFIEKIAKPKQPSAAEALRKRALNHCLLFDQQLKDNEYLSGNEYTIADIATFPVINAVKDRLNEFDYNHLLRWLKQLEQRPAVKKGMQIPNK